MRGVKTSCKVDDEWLSLIKEAKTIGLSLDEIKQFLSEVEKVRES